MIRLIKILIYTKRWILNLSKTKIVLYWQKEDDKAKTNLDILLKQALEQAAADYDRSEHRTYNAFLDPAFRKINAGNWQEAGFEDKKEAAKAYFYKMALTGSSAPTPDPENLKQSIRNSQFWNQLTADEQTYFQQKYYSETEKNSTCLFC